MVPPQSQSSAVVEPPNTSLRPNSRMQIKDTFEAPAATKRQKRRQGTVKRKVKRAYAKWRLFSRRHSWFNPLLIIVAFLNIYLFSPGTHNIARPLLFLSYPTVRSTYDPTAFLYRKGINDYFFIAFYAVFFTFTREFIMQVILKPLSEYLGVSKGKRVRFMEQAYSAVYFGLSSPWGLYVMRRSPVWYFDTAGMYAGFPHLEIEGAFKAYYLLQTAYWVQQALVMLLMLEKPRKDFRELVAHHFITISLIWFSYNFNFTHMGLAVYITHDISDFFLATSKTLNYIDSIFITPYFILFLFSWTYLRHVINIKILLSMLPYFSIGANPHPMALPRPDPWMTFDLPGFAESIYVWPSQFSTIGAYTVNWAAEQYKFWLSQIVTFSLLGALQLVNIFWFFLILNVAYRFILTGERKDDRSEDEEDQRTDVPTLPDVSDLSSSEGK